jgi:hypothetical protein
VSHIVIFRSPDGKPGYQLVDDLAGAVRHVEELRNRQGVDDIRIYTMEPVPFRFETVYQVRLDDAAQGGAPHGTPTASADLVDVARSMRSGASAPEANAGAVPAGAPAGTEGHDAGEDSGDADWDASGVRRGLFGR